MKRTLALLVAVIGAVTLSGCGSNSGPAAARVGSTVITRAELDDQLEALATNTAWMKQSAADFEVEQLSYPNGGVSTKLSALWLTAMIDQVVVDRAFERLDLTVNAQNRADAQEAADEFFSTDEGSTFDTMPKWFRDDFLENRSRYEAVKAKQPGAEPPTDSNLQLLLESLKTRVCPSGNAISHILVQTKAEADEVEAQLAQGADFATLATKSLDTNSSELGGFLTCTGSESYSQLPDFVAQPAALVPVGSVSAPIQSDYGYHIIRVTPFDLASMRALAVRAAQALVPDPMNALIEQRMKGAKIWVDPRYGTLKRSPVRVEPPQAPDPTSKPAR